MIMAFKRIRVIVAIIVVSLGLFAIAPLFDYNYYLLGLLTSAYLTATYVASWDLLNGYTGMLNFGQMLFAGVAAYTCALLETNFALPRPLILLIGVAAGTSSSLLLGLPSLRVKSSYFALVSFVLPLVFYRITMTFIDIFGGDYGLSVPRAFSKESLYYASIVIMGGVLIFLYLLTKSRIGMALKSIREDEDTARAVGISVPKFKLLACMISAFCTSLAGICMFYSLGHIGPEIFGMTASFNVVIMGVVGGAGTVFGAALGGGVLSMLLEFMRPIAEYRSIVYAILLVVFIMAQPKGLWGGLTVIYEQVFIRHKAWVRNVGKDTGN